MLDEATGPNGRVIFRTSWHRFPAVWNLTFQQRTIPPIWRLPLRLVGRDRAWDIHVRLESNDPLGPDLLVRTVQDRADIEHAMAALKADVREGRI